MSEKSNNPYYIEALSPARNPEWSARRDAAAAVRRVGEVLLAKDIDVTQLPELAASLNRLADRLMGARGNVIQGRNTLMGNSPTALLDDVAVVDYEVSPLSGLCNFIAPPMQVWYEQDCIKARVSMGWQYEGPPECVHGGFVAAMFDQLLGLGQSLTEEPGVTGTLNVRYHNKTPLNTELTMKGWVDRVEGRKNILCAEMFAGETKTASCEAVFIRIDHREWNIRPQV